MRTTCCGARSFNFFFVLLVCIVFSNTVEAATNKKPILIGQTAMHACRRLRIGHDES